MMLRLTTGQTYTTRDGGTAEVRDTLPNGNFIGFTTGFGNVLRVQQWNSHGETVQGIGNDDDIVAVHVLGYDTWKNLDFYGRDTTARLVKAFGDKKIVGIKLLRANFSWGLTEAKNIFEHVADGTWH